MPPSALLSASMAAERVRAGSNSRSATGETRARLRKVAARLFAERGYHGTSIGDVAAALDIHKSSVYAHIENKQDMLVDIALSSVEAFHAALDALDADAPAVERLRDALRTQAESINSQHDEGIVWLHEWRYLDGPARAQFVAERRRYEDRVRTIFEESIAEGSLRQDLNLDAALEIFFSTGSWAYSWIQERPDFEVDAGALWDILAQGFAASN